MQACQSSLPRLSAQRWSFVTLLAVCSLCPNHLRVRVDRTICKTPAQIGRIFIAMFITAPVPCFNPYRLSGRNFQGEMTWK